MCSSAAICALVRPWATRMTSSRSRALSCPGPGCRRLRRSRVGEHQGVLGRGGQAHRRAAVLGRPRPAGSQRLPGLAQLFLPAGLEPGRIGAALALVDRGARGPQRQGLGGAAGRGAQVPALGQAECAAQTRCRSAPRGGALPAGAPRRRRSGPPAGPGPRSWAARAPGSTGRPRPGPGPGPPRRRARLRPGPRHRPARWSAQSCTTGRARRGSRPRSARPAGPAGPPRRDRRHNRRRD